MSRQSVLASYGKLLAQTPLKMGSHHYIKKEQELRRIGAGERHGPGGLPIEKTLWAKPSRT